MFRKDGFRSSLLKPKQDKNGKRWNFAYWTMSIFRAQRLFFWGDDHSDMGVLIYTGPSTRNYRAITKIVEKLVHEPELRHAYRRDLRFPLDRYYAVFGSFPEEALGAELPPEASNKIQSV
jgi:hypothetical protein